jgi:hypothetical protein
MDDKNIKITSTVPSLEGKVEAKIKKGSETIYWYIKFNNMLDQTSITKDAMNVTDTQGYVMKTYITYDQKRNCIIISPIDTYKDKTYYLLNINETVKSAKGNNLKRPIHILFKLLGSDISDYQILKSTVRVPEPIPRPPDYDNMILDTKVEYFEKEVDIKGEQGIFEELEEPKEKPPEFPTKPVKINFVGTVAGFLLLLASIPISNLIFSVAALTSAAIGTGNLILQLSKKSTRSTIVYNMGTANFKKGNYLKAYSQFIKAYEIDETNELAEFASKKAKYYI